MEKEFNFGDLLILPDDDDEYAFCREEPGDESHEGPRAILFIRGQMFTVMNVALDWLRENAEVKGNLFETTGR